MSDYQTFLAGKRRPVESHGFPVEDYEINSQLFPFQRAIVRWAIQRGRAAVFADCGLGKTPMQLEWASHIVAHTDMPVLILAPLAVAAQTAREGEKFGVPVTVCRSQADVQMGVNITNYEMLAHFDRAAFGGLVLDESSILKAFDGVTRKALTEFGRAIPYRLCCTATPAPNDLIELTNHAEFLDIMSGKEIVALYFTQDGNTTHAWRLKGHARRDFWRWLASWSVAMRRPSDLGYSDDGFTLPPLRYEQHHVAGVATNTLFPVEALTLQERQAARRVSTPDRVAVAAEMINASDRQWIVWCNLNAESIALVKAIPGSVEVTGADSREHKERAVLDFIAGRARVLVTKPLVCGFGLNLQFCADMAFVGLSDSYEQLYQAVRRCWRFGQDRPVTVHMITAETEGAVVANIQRKERQATEMMASIVAEMAGLSLGRTERDEMTYREDVATGQDWTVYLGDSVLRLAEVPDNSVGITVTSPPFPGMYTYTNSAHDMGNVASIDEMIGQFRHLIPELYRVTVPGRHCCVHLTQAVAFKGTDGYVGLKDFRGRVIAAMEDDGWIYYGEVTIDKDPQVKAVRTKERGLLFKTLANDSSHMRMALADYLLQFRKPGDSAAPIAAGISAKYRPDGAGWITNEEWIEWAAPVWYRKTGHYPGGISETDVLNVSLARETDDERHLCPLQLGVIERAIKLWSAPGDLVLDPFNGVGSTGAVALKLKRRYVGCELKESYWRTSIANLKAAEAAASTPDLFALAGVAVAG
jgi:DNA modification methylase